MHSLHSGHTSYPKFKDDNGVTQFDIVVANPPWNQDGYDETVLRRESSGKKILIRIRNQAVSGLAWIQHMLASAKNKGGKVGLVIDNGCLFRVERRKLSGQRFSKKQIL